MRKLFIRFLHWLFDFITTKSVFLTLPAEPHQKVVMEEMFKRGLLEPKHVVRLELLTHDWDQRLGGKATFALYNSYKKNPLVIKANKFVASGAWKDLILDSAFKSISLNGCGADLLAVNESLVAMRAAWDKKQSMQVAGKGPIRSPESITLKS